MISEPDDLYTLRNHFWLGNYQMALSEGSGLSRLSGNLKAEKDVFMYRSYIALGQYDVVLNEVRDDMSPALQACRLLAMYLGQPDSKEIVLITLADWLQDQTNGNDATLRVIAATVYLHEGDLRKACRAVIQGSTLQQALVLVQIYIRLGRPDMATDQAKKMQRADEDAPLTQLALAWSHLATGGSRASEAAYIFEELMAKFAASPLLLAGAAAARMAMGQWDTAETHLVQAASKNQNDPDTLVNLIACYQHLDKPEEFRNRYINQLKATAPTHPYVLSLTTVEGAFERVAANYALA